MLKTWHWLVCAGIVIFVGAVLWPVTACACKKATSATACLYNVKQLSLSLQVYLVDFDNRLPDRDHWMDSIEKYVKNPALLADPSIKAKGEYGYSFDSRLSQQPTAAFPVQEQQPALFDSLNLGRNASDPFISLPKPGRHDGKNSVGYLDGHVKSQRWKQ